MKWFSIGLFTTILVLSLVLILTRGERVDAAADSTGLFFDNMGATILVFTQALVNLTVVAGFVVLAVVGGWGAVHVFGKLQDAKTRPLRMKDGAFALQVHDVPGGKIFWNPNNSMDDFAALTEQGAFAWSGNTFAPEQRVQYMVAQEQANVARAMFPGDDARSHRFGHLSDMPRSVGRALAAPKPLKQIAETPAGPIIEGRVAPLYSSGRAALEASRPERWVLGQNKENGAVAVFRPEADVHAAIVGATGSGKTTNAGYAMALNAIKSGGRLVILDGDDGADWSSWANVAEWHETDENNLPDFMDAIAMERDRRMEIIRAHDLRDIGSDPAVLRDNPRTFILIEEYGSLMDRIRAQSRAKAARVDFVLNELMRKSRKAGMHIILLDQYPDKWSDQTLVNAKTKIVFNIDGGKGAKVSAYKSDNLDIGQFVLRNDAFDGFNLTQEAPAILRELPIIPAPPLIEGTVTRSEVVDSTPIDLGVDLSMKRDVIYAWRNANPDGSQADFRRWLAEKHGAEYGRGYISDCFKEWEAERATELT